MQRRELLRLLGSAVTIPALAGHSPEQLLTLGRIAHARTLGGAHHGVSAHTSETIAAIAELVLPAGDTPGAGAVGVPEFISIIVTEWQTEEERRNLLAGLDDLDQRSRTSGAASFLALPADSQARLLRQVDAGKGAGGSAESSFATIKSLTVFGYFTSERVMTEVLHSPMIPGRYDGCAPLHTQ